MKSNRLKIAIVTGSRAEYGLLKPLITSIKANKKFQLQLIVTGMHLSPEFGLTYKVIENDGFLIDERVDMLLSGDSDASIVKSTGLGIVGMADVFLRLHPDWVILLGDRFETFSAAYVAHQLKIPIAHLHGGELTEGATDDAMRHAITKMSFLHFTSTETYRKRVIQLGEHPSRVFNVGAIGVETISKFKSLSKLELSKSLSASFGDLNFLVTYHPVTLENTSVTYQMEQLVKALSHFKDAKIFITMPNADAGGRGIMKLIEQFAQQNSDRVYLFTSLGEVRYLSLLKIVNAVIGNSSSGIIEAPAYKVPTVNIGDRQKGRVKGDTVIDTGIKANSIIKGIERALSKEFLSKAKKAKNLYSKPNTSDTILSVIQRFGKLSSLKKKFYDVK